MARTDKQSRGRQHIAIHADLNLIAGVVADPHRLRALIAFQRRIALFRHLAALQCIAGAQAAVVTANGVRQPGKRRLTVFQRSQINKRLDNQAGVAYPGVAVIVVFIVAELFRQRGGGRRRQRAGRRIPEKLQRQRRAPDMTVVAPVIRQPVSPVAPGGMAGFDALIDFLRRRDRQRLALGGHQRHQRARRRRGGKGGGQPHIVALFDAHIIGQAQHRHQFADVPQRMAVNLVMPG